MLERLGNIGYRTKVVIGRGLWHLFFDGTFYTKYPAELIEDDIDKDPLPDVPLPKVASSVLPDDGTRPS